MTGRKWWFRRPNPWLFGLELALTTPSVAQALPVAVVAGAIGAAATSFAAIAVTAVVNFAITMAASALLNAVLSPSQQQRQASIIALSVGEGPRMAVFGRAALGGTLADAFNWGGQYGTDWECQIIVLADHKCEALTQFYVNDQLISYPSGGFSGGTVPDQGSVAYNGQLKVWWLDGSASQTLPSIVTNGGWSTTGNFSGICVAVVAYKADDPQSSNPVWSGGRPSFLWVVKGKRCYDPRKDSSVGGSGSHRWTDPSTWEWTENAAVCRYNWVRGIYAKDQVTDPGSLLLGRGLSSIEAPEANVFAWAAIADEDVPLRAGGSEKRYRVGGVIKSTDKFVDTEQMFADAMGGIVIQPGGSVEVEPGHARAPTFAITDDDLITGSSVKYDDFRSISDLAWCNTVVARYSEPTQKWQDHAAPVRRVSSDVTADGSPREAPLSLGQVNSGTQAQRLAEIKRRLGRLTRTATIVLGPRFNGIEEGDWGTWTSARRFGGATVTFRVEAYRVDEKRQITVTLREIASSVYDWTASVDEAVSDIVSTGASAPPAAWLRRYGTAAIVDQQLIASSYPIDADPADGLMQATSTTIAIEAHSRTYSDRTVSVGSGSLSVEDDGATALVAGGQYHVYYDDLDRAGGAVAYKATRTATVAANSSAHPARHYVGMITMAAAGGSSTGSGAVAPGFQSPGWDATGVIYDGGNAQS